MCWFVVCANLHISFNVLLYFLTHFRKCSFKSNSNYPPKWLSTFKSACITSAHQWKRRTPIKIFNIITRNREHHIATWVLQKKKKKKTLFLSFSLSFLLLRLFAACWLFTDCCCCSSFVNFFMVCVCIFWLVNAIIIWMKRIISDFVLCRRHVSVSTILFFFYLLLILLCKSPRNTSQSSLW